MVSSTLTSGKRSTSSKQIDLNNIMIQTIDDIAVELNDRIKLKYMLTLRIGRSIGG